MLLSKYFKKALEILGKVSEFLLELIFPPRCVICDRLYRKDKVCAGTDICPECMEKIRFVKNFTSVCRKCSRPIDEDSILCMACQVSDYSFDAGFSCTLYENEMRLSLLSYKFNDARYKYRTFSDIMYREMNRISPFPHIDVICSVPLSKKRMKKRGFNHVAPFAKYISAKTGIPYNKKALAKIKDTPPQSTLSFKERRLAVKGAYKVLNPSFVRGKSVLLIDDIYTTGATVSEISKILKRAGAKYVAVLTLCITPEINIGDDLNI